MERVVGGTLIVLACWIFYSLANYFVSARQLPMQSRWMITMAVIKTAVSKITGKPQSSRVDPPSAKTSFAIGTLHAIGAETGTQVLLLTAVGTTAAANDHMLGILLLLSFVLGLIFSNAMVAMLSRLGFACSKLTGPVYATTALCTAVFSLTVGIFFLSGQPDKLPDLQQLFDLQI